MTRNYVDLVSACGEFDLFLDAGPAVSRSEAMAARHLNRSATIVGFEPYWPHFDAIIAEGYAGNMLFPFGLGAKHETRPIAAIGPRNAGIHFTSSIEGAVQHDASLVALDEICAAFANVFCRPVLWADVEGNELDMLHGARRLLSKQWFTSILLEIRSEVQSPYASDSWCLDADVIAYLRQHGYELKQEWLADESSNARDALFVRLSA